MSVVADKHSVLRGDADDDNQPNTYDRTDSFLDDQTPASLAESKRGGAGDSDEEDVGQLVKEAKDFMGNKKMVNAAKN